MSTVLETPARGRRAGAPATRPGPPSFALARFEARELLLQIPVLSSSPSCTSPGPCGSCSTQRQGDYPVLQDVDRGTQGMPMLVGLAPVMLGVNRAVLRSRRRDTDRALRRAGHGAVAAYGRPRAVRRARAVLFTALVVGVQFTWAGAQARRGRPRFARRTRRGPADGPAVRRARCPAGPPDPLGLRRAGPRWSYLLFALLSAASPGGTAWVSWLGPVVTESGSDTVPLRPAGRPAAWHALYLVGLSPVAGRLAVLVSGGRTTVVKAVVAGSRRADRGGRGRPVRGRLRPGSTRGPRRGPPRLRRRSSRA